jgi:predicted MPP superfamily phosphohydrolase
MFGTGLIVAYSIMLVYVSWRAASVPLIDRHVSRKCFVGAGFVLWVVFYLARTWAHHGSGPLAKALEFVGMTCLGVMFLCSIALLAVDLGTGFGRLLPSWASTLRGWALVAGGLLSSLALVQGLRAPAVVSYEVVLPGLPAGLEGKVLVAMSDTHLGAFVGERWMDARIAEVQALNPDLVVFLGDMFEGHSEAPVALPALSHLSAPLGKWFVTGNHEFHHHSGASIGVLARAGFRRLDDTWAEAAPGLIVAGVNDLTAHDQRGLEGDPIGRALAGRPAGATVLLSHTPRRAEMAERAGAELMISGHTHGGQIWPFGHLVRTVYPLLGGQYSVNGMPVIVCRGTRTWGPPMRLWRRGEILRVTLRASPSRESDSRGSTAIYRGAARAEN